MYVKVCGITSPKDAESAVAAGADAIGIILFTDSKRSVTLRRAEAILKAVSGRVETVCVTTTRCPADISSICRLSPDAIQTYHDHTIPDRFVSISGWDGITLPTDAADCLLLDASHGRGIPLNVHHAKAAIAKTKLPVILSGGLTSSSVGDVIRSVGPAGVDVSSGVEIRPGVKDLNQVKAFISACRGEYP
ncbi:MAG: phosphoribosylanthranilate isomerase [Methanocalculus sp.]|uniref:phosphoribosylanthranilate isomerase n=1 Tax=Methanocalculus sp. TaxID=2004547 RepID=UPI00271E8CBA|nr:phosphoribosylanthranilate isomerase [Methanocalculus sp.]MDO9538894.1 phosphoribosylanthranilate isomerase [Methanocalculus sp.]